jgi:hypothetical protein
MCKLIKEMELIIELCDSNYGIVKLKTNYTYDIRNYEYRDEISFRIILEESLINMEVIFNILC